MSRTFHGRDLFSPAAAHLALGVEPAELGPPLTPDALVRLELPEASFDDGVIDATRPLRRSLREHAAEPDARGSRADGIVPGTRFELEFAGERYYATAARTFADARPGEIVLYEDSYRNISIAINRGSAAEMFAVQPGQHILLHPEQP